jgi:hypothetical protein
MSAALALMDSTDAPPLDRAAAFQVLRAMASIVVVQWAAVSGDGRVGASIGH